MKEVAELLEEMIRAGVLTDYAIFGAVAQMRYTDAVATLDADILVAVPDPQRLDALSPLYQFCTKRGYKPEGEAIRVGGWPVRFIPVFNRLTEAALRHAETGEIDGVPLRVVSADYLAVIALSVGRPKDFIRVVALLEVKAVSRESIEQLCLAHGLGGSWTKFRSRYIDV